MFLSVAIVAAVTSTGVVPLDQFHWQGRIPAGQSIEIKGVYGSIRAEPAAGDRAEVLAYKAGVALDPAEVQVDMVQHAGGITFRARTETVPDERIDFMVRVPRGVHFIGRTVNGSVFARQLSADASAYTVNGNVSMSTDGQAQAETVNGSITASLGRLSSHRNLKFSTVNGGITLEMPARANASIHARTQHGGIRSDFRVPMDGHVSGRSAHGILGKGGADVNLNTVNGDIRLRRVVMPL